MLPWCTNLTSSKGIFTLFILFDSLLNLGITKAHRKTLITRSKKLNAALSVRNIVLLLFFKFKFTFYFL